MSSVKGRFSFSKDDGDELQSSLRLLFNGQDSNHSNNPTDNMDFHQIKGTSDFGSSWLTSNTGAVNVKVLLVFAQDDRQSDILVQTCEKLGWHVSEARNADEALELFQTHYHDIVIIDRRGVQRQQADDICRFFTESNQDECTTLQVLDAGFNRALIECSNQKILINELIGIHANEVQAKLQLATAHSLYLAVHRCRDMIHVTNDRHVIQFANEVTEKLLGYKLDEVINKNLNEIITCENFNLMNQLLQKGLESYGNMNCKRKFNGPITISSRIIPFCTHGRRPTHYIYIYDTTYLLENIEEIEKIKCGWPHTVSHLHPRGSAHSSRSFDVGSVNSDLQRRCSIAKLHNLPIEAPITKVITLLTSAMMDAALPEVVNQINKAIEILKTTELFAPYVKESGDLTNDPITSDLIGALISAPLYARDSRRSSNDSVGRVQRILRQQSPKPTSRSQRGPREIELLLENSLSWEFDIFKLEMLSEKRSLFYLGMHIMNLYGVPAQLKCEERVLLNWLTVIEGSYNVQNSYHNSTHAADVLQATARFMMSDRLKSLLGPLDQAAALIAAATHDVDHPGVTSQFICNAGQRLAVLYNDISVLESHHAALTFKLTLADSEVNIFKALDRDTYKSIRQNIIDMILATDMTKHYEHLAKFVNICSVQSEESMSELYSDAVDSSPLSMAENVTLVKRMMIKCADVSNPARPLKLCIEWSKRIAEEYFRQTEAEQERNLPVTMPTFERSSCSIAASQIGFVDYIVSGMMEAWDAFIDLPEIIKNIRQNYGIWKEHSKSEIFTVQDCERLQQSLKLHISQST
ncbi:high affinity cAMP-specific and IBMX-insensitive 3',5'-cyclic phosphodiesterase 8-like isoform X2 [Copidosoma floridanum]|uniref:high affinity cAMP-specific and IBMX-insensitive 3',5'-cyclic phosphodiesterase 8-like isoform X2 n=1 Tax=Copidosoma floridanum TaxID=29053 RepID=UPI0006C9C43E|nr:high affinity cAMP-specific and IBMX-insensitive 3',5'-cyclic phosphodiesterase 8-like isoform X2 [Copidosoma floridanum]